MKSSTHQILELLSNNEVTFFIPPYQRNYEWSVDMCEVLFKDIQKVADNTNYQHFFGSICYHSEDKTFGHPDKLILVDGQQRITTIMLFLIAARDIIEDNSIKNFIDSKYLKNNNVTDDVEYKIKLKQIESDWNSYKNLILSEPLTDVDKKSNVFKNYTFFKSNLANLDQSKIINLIQSGLSNFIINTLELEPSKNVGERPQEIFESLNSLGKPLSLADLIRNYLLLGKSSEQQEILYKNYWLKIEKNLSGDNLSFTISSFIRDYMQLVDMSSYKKTTETNYKELYRNFKELFSDDEPEELIKVLLNYSIEYAIIAGYRSSGNFKLDQKLKDLRTLKISAFYSFILEILYLRTQQKINDDDCLDILHAIFVYVARKSILGIRKSENKNAGVFPKHIDELITSSNKIDKMFEILSNQSYSMRLPNDTEVQNFLLSPNSNFYNSEVSKFLFCLIEESITKNRPDMSAKILQVEHIMPQTLTEEWKQMLGENYQEIHDKYSNHIGNLTLVRHNLELSNNSFDAKKEIYENFSGIQITKNKIIDQSRWTQVEIENRAIYLIQILLNKILQIPPNLKTSNNYSTLKKSKVRSLSFEKLELIGKEIEYFDDKSIKAVVVDNKQLEFEGKIWKLSPLTREIETRKSRRNSSGAYWGVNMWKYRDKTLEDLIDENMNFQSEDEDESE